MRAPYAGVRAAVADLPARRSGVPSRAGEIVRIVTNRCYAGRARRPSAEAADASHLSSTATPGLGAGRTPARGVLEEQPEESAMSNSTAPLQDHSHDVPVTPVAPVEP